MGNIDNSFYKKMADIARVDEILKNYKTKPINDRFTEIMHLYSKIEPEWKKRYNDLEKEKPKELQFLMKLEEVEEIEDLINSAWGDELLETCLAIHVSNKIAHCYDRYINEAIITYLKLKADEGKIEKEIFADEGKMKRICFQISSLFDPVNKNDMSTKTRLTRYLKKDNIDETMLKEIGEIGLEHFIVGRRNAFAVKDFEIENALRILAEDNEISYGILQDEKLDRKGKTLYDGKGNPIYANTLVVDLPFYGQFAVHMKDDSSISVFSDIPRYNRKFFYERKSVMLTDGISRIAKNWVGARNRQGIPSTYEGLRADLKEIERSNPRYAHYLALKLTGATREQLKDLHNRRNGGRSR